MPETWPSLIGMATGSTPLAPHQRPQQTTHQLPADLIGGLAHGRFHHLAGQTTKQLTRCAANPAACLCLLAGSARFALLCLLRSLLSAGGQQFVSGLTIDWLVVAAT